MLWIWIYQEMKPSLRRVGCVCTITVLYFLYHRRPTMAKSGGLGIHGFLTKDSSNSSGAKEDVTQDELMRSEYNMPTTLTDKRHIEKILGTSKCSGTWRMKERVSQQRSAKVSNLIPVLVKVLIETLVCLYIYILL